MPLTILAGGSWTPHPQLITTIHRGHLVTKPEVILQSFSIPHVTRTSYMYILKCLSVLHPAPPPGSHPFSQNIQITSSLVSLYLKPQPLSTIMIPASCL